MEEAAKETVIIVHGTYAAPKPGVSRWYQPAEGVPATEFITKLNDALQKRGSAAQCWAHCSQGDPGFHWSGENHWVARTQAAAALTKYVLKLRKEGWSCHMVAHSHGGNVVLEALPKIATALPFSAPMGKIVTLGTPFMDTMSPILQRIRANERLLIGLSWIALIWLILSLAIWWVLIWAFPEMTSTETTLIGAVFGTMITFLAAASVFAFLVFSRKSQTEPILNTDTQIQPKFLAIGSDVDEPWQLLHSMQDAPNPMAVDKKLIRYVASSLRSDIAESKQVARIYEAKSYRDLKRKAKVFLAFMHLMFCLLFLFPALSAIVLGIYFTIETMIRFGQVDLYYILPTATGMVIWFSFIVSWFVLILLFTFILGREFYSAFFSPFRWCARLVAITGIVRAIATYIVRSRGWSVVLAIAMGLEGYRHEIPRIEQCPSSVPGVTYENMPTGAQQSALAKRGAWIDRHLDNVTQTFSKLVVTSADIDLLLRTIQADQTLVHAAYYTDDECIARIADWIAAKDDMHSNAAIAAGASGDA